MKKYDKEKWGITFREYNKLMEAVELGIVPSIYINDTTIYRLKIGDITVDDFIDSIRGRREYSSNFPPERTSISQEEFEDIVSDVLDYDSDVVSYKFFDKAVEVFFRSRSGKQKWSTLLNYNDNGVITGRFGYTQIYQGATNPVRVGSKIRSRIKSKMYE